ncbi:MAG: hypothetical protein LBM04_07310 [Opitutaceae bacterium]|nr:hypothetical protein [Opitutaceae bacterium]
MKIHQKEIRLPARGRGMYEDGGADAFFVMHGEAMLVPGRNGFRPHFHWEFGGKGCGVLEKN